MDEEREIQALLSHLSEAERAVFEDYFHTELDKAIAVADAEAQGSATGAADRLVVEADLVEEIALLAEARSPDSQGVGFVPIPGGEMNVVPPTRNPFEDAPPSEADTAIPVQGMTPRRRMVVAAGVVALGGSLLLVNILGNRSTTPTVPVTTQPGAAASANARSSPRAGQTEAEANAETAQLYGVEAGASTAPLVDAEVRRAKAGYPSSLEIVTTSDEDRPPLPRAVHSALVYRVVPSTGQLGGSWTPDLEAGTAAWLSGSYVNSIFCLPPDTEAILAELPSGSTVLMRPATGDVRQYKIVRVQRVGRQQTEVLSQRKAGMTLIACGVPGDERIVAEAVYQPPVSRELAPLAAQGNELPNYLRAEVDDIDAQLLDEQLVRLNVAVTLENLSGGAVEWTDLHDQLLVGGQVAQPTGRVEWAPLNPGERQRVVYSYVVPRDAGETVWQVLAPTGESIDLRFAVPTMFE